MCSPFLYSKHDIDVACAEKDDEIDRLNELVGELKEGEDILHRTIDRLRAQLAEAKRSADTWKRECQITDGKLAEAKEEVQEWRDAAKLAAGETCGDERHCTCVPVLRQRIRRLEDLLGRVYNELTDPMSEKWCDKPEEDRELLESLLRYVIEEMGWQDEHFE